MSDFPVVISDNVGTPTDAPIVNSVLNISNINRKTVVIRTLQMRPRNFTITFKL